MTIYDLQSPSSQGNDTNRNSLLQFKEEKRTGGFSTADSSNNKSSPQTPESLILTQSSRVGCNCNLQSDEKPFEVFPIRSPLHITASSTPVDQSVQSDSNKNARDSSDGPTSPQFQPVSDYSRGSTQDGSSLFSRRASVVDLQSHNFFRRAIGWCIRWLATAYFGLDLFIVAICIMYFLVMLNFIHFTIGIPLRIKRLKWLRDLLDEKMEHATGSVLNFGAYLIVRLVGWVWTVKAVLPPEPDQPRRFSLLGIPIEPVDESSDPSVKIVPFSKAPLPKLPARCMIMSNHLSNLDGFLIRGFLWPDSVKCCYKGSISRVPFVGWDLFLAGDVPINFNKQKGGWGVDSPETVMLKTQTIMNHNCHFLVFPEGMRRKFNRMSPFRHGYFRLAIHNKYPIWPVVVHGTDKAWAIHASTVQFASLYLSYSDKVIYPEASDTPASLAARVRHEMLRLLQRVPGYDEFAERPFETLEEFRAFEEQDRQKRIGIKNKK